jgi:hypothetical protein
MIYILFFLLALVIGVGIIATAYFLYLGAYYVCRFPTGR